ncbi:putative aromatic aminotransferase Aro8 [Aspergillus steynii IBT 23096]|uniref:Putative aromatic aminotransferase Aro8 n=1 Tax=Aspergillus steynii IBT 23096 TaxID=1392250 RepID=A0A2I2GPS7_9EURO|nr:putative aromatic aminotransferase Aro8 [Aspergillus steynii IBT 23096]PLB54887.1 putative aromatic aminotransferase Aro8 [Aspergillus steynii IBT 23096]
MGSQDTYNGKAALNDARDWSHLFSAESASRKPSVMQAMHGILAQPGIRSLGPGAPSTEYFPFYSMDFEVGSTDAFETVGMKIPDTTTAIHAGKYDNTTGTSIYDLEIALQYGLGTGSKQLVKFLTEHVQLTHNPPYRNWQTILSAGTTSAFEIVLRMLGQPGEYLLVEQHTYTTVFETGLPLGWKFAQVRMDNDGLLPDDLDDLLSTWDEKSRAGPKPRVLYTIPTGQNPTGITQPLPRRQAIYRVAQKHNLFILEDDPYYFIQMPVYNPATRGTPTPVPSLLPSYLSLDTDGRVLRMDSFSKIIAPGARMGWVTAPAQVIERMVRTHEVSVQNPSGFSQIAMFKLLHDSWGHAGFARWLAHLQGEYAKRRDALFEACDAHLPREIVSWVPPTSGFFAWIQIDWKKHPQAGDRSALLVERQVYDAAIACGALVVPGSWFLPDEGAGGMDEVFFRMTYAAASVEDMREAVRRLGMALREVFGLV